MGLARTPHPRLRPTCLHACAPLAFTPAPHLPVGRNDTRAASARAALGQERMAKHRLKLQRGLEITDADWVTISARCWKTVSEWPLPRSILRFLVHYEPFRLSYVSIASRLGSSTASYLDIASNVIALNVFLAALWLPLVILPQLSYSECGRDVRPCAGLDPLPSGVHVWCAYVSLSYPPARRLTPPPPFFGQIGHDFWYMFDSQTSTDNSTWEGEPSLIFVGGYKPRYYPSPGAASGFEPSGIRRPARFEPSGIRAQWDLSCPAGSIATPWPAC